MNNKRIRIAVKYDLIIVKNLGLNMLIYPIGMYKN